jgi:hypothetical protein
MIVAQRMRDQLFRGVLLLGCFAAGAISDTRAQSYGGSQPPTLVYAPYQSGGGVYAVSGMPGQNIQVVWPQDPAKCRAEALRLQSKKRYEQAKATGKQPTIPLFIPPQCDITQPRADPDATMRGFTDADLAAAKKAAVVERARRAALAAQQAAEERRRLMQFFNILNGDALERFMNGQ